VEKGERPEKPIKISACVVLKRAEPKGRPLREGRGEKWEKGGREKFVKERRVRIGGHNTG